MTTKPLHIGVAACFFQPDPNRAMFKYKTLLFLVEAIGRWIQSGNAIPWLVPMPAGSMQYEEILSHVDGLVLQGGADLSPEAYGEELLNEEWKGDPMWDDYETELVRTCMRLNRPVFGICRGMQLINVALGGTLYQDILTQAPGSRVHREGEIYDGLFHDIKFEANSKMQRLYPGRTGGKTNTIHHQGVKDVAPDLVVEAKCVEDGIIEAVRLKDGALARRDCSPADGSAPYVYAVQWHPEFQDPQDTSLLSTLPLLTDFLEAAAERRGKREAGK